MRIAIFGSGGVGGYFGGRLAQAGHSVAFLARGVHLDAIRRDGLTVESLAGDFAIKPAEATASPREVGPVDAVLICVKAWQVPEAAAALGPLLGSLTCVVPLVNGVEACDQLAAAIGAERVLGGLCRIVAFIVSPGRIRHAAIQPSIELGERNGRPSARAAVLAEALARAPGVEATIPDDIEAAIWEKFLFIAPFSGVGAVTRQPAGAFRHVPETRAMLRAAMEEVLELARARGVRLGSDSVERTLRFTDALPAEATASMQRDILEGRPSELEAQNGAIVRLARESGVSVPVNESIYRSLLPAELRAREAAAR
ncbi:MAG TPA: 2-dehydropantoate 2-reductase [Candidatus Polarisedimenticolaceae bacterium]|nr:2-dehydropantoate 2-reductase [Candidatus Polarisedimenticolaceae bacterium]